MAAGLGTRPGPALPGVRVRPPGHRSPGRAGGPGAAVPRTAPGHDRHDGPG